MIVNTKHCFFWEIANKRKGQIRAILAVFLIFFTIGQVSAQTSFPLSELMKNEKIVLDSNLQQKNSIGKKLPDFVLYFIHKKSISICLKNDLGFDFSFYLYVGSPNLLKQHSINVVRSRSGVNALIVSEKGNNSELAYNGFLAPLSKREDKKHFQVFPYKFAAGEEACIQLHFFDLHNRKANTQLLLLSSQGFLEISKQQELQKRNSFFIGNIYVGGILIMFFFTIAIYVQNKQADFGFYACYLICVLVFGVLDAFPLHFHDWFIWEFPKNWIYAKETVAYAYLIFYHSFLIRFLELKEKKSSLYKILRAINFTFFGFFLLNLVSVLLPFSLFVLYKLIFWNSIVFYSLFVFYLHLFWKLWFMRDLAFSKYIFWGSFIFYLGNVLGIIFGNFSNLSEPFFPNNFTQIGTLIEVLFFALGLGRKALLDSEEKNKLQKQVIEQLEEKKQLIQRINERLEKEVAEKTEEILSQAQSLQAEKEEKMRLQFGKQLQEMRLYAIQTQLNPHFLFNCLNTIKSLVVSGENEKASIYLNQFAKLMRSTLENSEKLKINLKESIEYLKNYVEMEKLRFKEDFDFEISFEGEEDPELLQVPPMLIQPFVENAIIHGLVPSKKYKMLKIEFIEEEDFLICKVKDNGQGFDTKPQNKTHQSKGLKMIQTYFDLWNVQKNEKATFIIKSQANLGTEVQICIPI